MRAVLSAFGWLLRHPFRAAVVGGVIVAVVFGAASFPEEEQIQKTLDDWLPEDASDDQAVVAELISSLERAQQDDGAQITRVSEERFREINPSIAHAFTEVEDGDFLIRYLGQEPDDDTLYLADRKVQAAPWWHPDRFLYKAVDAETSEARNVLELTFERDWQGLLGLLFLDLAVGSVYGVLTGLIVGVLHMTGLEPPAPAGAGEDIVRQTTFPRGVEQLPFRQPTFGDASPTPQPPPRL